MFDNGNISCNQTPLYGIYTTTGGTPTRVGTPYRGAYHGGGHPVGVGSFRVF